MPLIFNLNLFNKPAGRQDKRYCKLYPPIFKIYSVLVFHYNSENPLTIVPCFHNVSLHDCFFYPIWGYIV